MYEYEDPNINEMADNVFDEVVYAERQEKHVKKGLDTNETYCPSCQAVKKKGKKCPVCGYTPQYMPGTSLEVIFNEQNSFNLEDLDKYEEGQVKLM